MSIKEILSNAKTIAIIGCSSRQYRTSYMIANYLLEAGYEIVPVNPNETLVFGRPCYPAIYTIPADLQIDIVNIFRNKMYTLDMINEIVDWSMNMNVKPAIWTQLDVSTSASKELALNNGHQYIENRCILVEHKRFI